MSRHSKKKSNSRRSAREQKRIAGHLEKINLFAASIDIASETHFVAAPEKLNA